jgi:hypothetical protein
MLAPDRLGRISDVSALVCGGKIVSTHLGFIGRGRFYYVLPAFDTEYRSLAVGILLLDRLVERCSAERYAVFDLGEGDFSYKTKWATHRLPLLACEQAVTPVGALFGGLRRVRNLVGIEQLYGLCANGRAGLTMAARRLSLGAGRPIRIDRTPAPNGNTPDPAERNWIQTCHMRPQPASRCRDPIGACRCPQDSRRKRRDFSPVTPAARS